MNLNLKTSDIKMLVHPSSPPIDFALNFTESICNGRGEDNAPVLNEKIKKDPNLFIFVSLYEVATRKDKTRRPSAKELMQKL